LRCAPPPVCRGVAALLTGTTSANLAAGLATFSNLVISSAASNDALTATLALNSSLNLTAQSSPFQVTSQFPSLIAPTAGTVLATSNITFTWTLGIGVTGYDLYLGTNGVGSANLYNTGHIATTSFTAPTLPAAGATIYARLWYQINGVWQSVDYTYKEQ